MNPELIDNMSWEMAEVYGAITDQILINLAHYFPYFKPGQPVPVSSFEYQANMLAQMGQVNKDTIKIIRNGLSGADEALKGSLEQAIIEAVSKAQPELLEGIKKGILAPAGKPILSPSLSRAFSLYYQQAADKLNLVNTVMLESTQSAYQQCVSDVVAEIGLADSMNRLQIALDTAAGETVTGVSAWNQALKHATDRMKETGIVGFIDHAGHRWSAEAYTAMDIRTTVANTARAATWETNQDFGNDLYQVSYHNGARPLCYPWQSKVISSLDAARTVIDLDGNEITVYAQSSTTYGQAAGLFGINCKHYPTPFIPGVSLVRDGAQSEADNAKSYKESQQQRGLERKIREQKRDLLMLKEQGAPKEMLKAQREKIRKTDDEIDAFCDMTGRARRQNREAVYTKRDFPSSKTYDVSQFERKQKDIIDNFFGGGGAQQNYTAGQMTPNQIPVTQMPAQQKVVTNTIQTGQSVLQSNGGVKATKDFKEFKTYMQKTYGIEVTSGVARLDFNTMKEAISGFEDVAKDFPEVAKGIKKIRLSRSGVMACDGENITFNSDYFTDAKDIEDTIKRSVKRRWWQEGTTVASIGAHETAHGVEMVLIENSGKYITQRSKVLAWNDCIEARDIVKEACDALLALPENSGKTGFELISEEISGYGAKGGNSETMAEAFADVNARGTKATPLARKIYEITLKKYKQYMGGKP